MAEETKTTTRKRRTRKKKEEVVDEPVVEITQEPVVEEKKEEPVVEEMVTPPPAPLAKNEVSVGDEIIIANVAGKFKVLNGKKGKIVEKIGGTILVSIDGSKYSLTVKNVEA